MAATVSRVRGEGKECVVGQGDRDNFEFWGAAKEMRVETLIKQE